MHANDVFAILMLRPFRPFRIHVADGTFHDVNHPETISMNSTLVYLSSPHTTETIHIAIPHITKIVPLSTNPPDPFLATSGEQMA